MPVEPSRVFHLVYIFLDICFLTFLFGVLFVTKRYMAIWAGIAGAVIYFIVDYGIFYLILGTRTVTGTDPFLLLLWLSVSYGFTNFVWIWLWFDRDGHTLEWSLLIVAGWFATGLLGQSLGAGSPEISIARGTGMYHGFMGLILLVGYAIICVHNITAKHPSQKFPIVRILSIGVLVQFGWEFVLLITGIRAQGLGPIIVDSLLETNLGAPFIFLIHRYFSARMNEDMSPAARRAFSGAETADTLKTANTNLM